MPRVNLGDWTRHALNAPMFKKYGVKHFRLEVDDGYLEVFVGREPLGENGELEWHLSIAMKSRLIAGATGPRYPTWDEIKDARYRFCPRDLTMAMLLPPPSEYVNLHKTTFHLHELKAGSSHL